MSTNKSPSDSEGIIFEDSNGESWGAYRHMVLAKLERFEELIDTQDKEISSLKTEVASLKTEVKIRAALFGTGAGLIISILGLIVKFLS